MNSRNIEQHFPQISGLNAHQSQDERVSRALEEYAESFEKNQPLSRASLLKKYGDVAEELTGCLDSLEFIRDIAPQIAEEQLGSDDARPETAQQRVTVGDYRIVREIGRGGMGVVYEAEQLSLGRSVALKVLPYAAMLDGKAITRFKNEARAAATLDHPHIVPVFAVGVERGIHYYAMSLIDGLTVAELVSHLQGSITDTGSTDPLSIDDFLERRGDSNENVSASHLEPTIDSGQQTKKSAEGSAHPADETHRDVEAAVSTQRSRFNGRYFRSVARMSADAANALDHAHQHGIVHRDIKPGNLMIDSETKLWVTDFGLARIESDPGMTMTGDIVGTLRYMAPEQAMAKRVVVDNRADIYSLGASLYEMLALRPPFEASSRENLLKQIAFEELKPLRHINRAVPEDLQTIVHKALSKNPDDRYQTAAEMADDLCAFVADEPINARPLSIAQRASRWAAKRKSLVASVAGVLILAVIGLLISNAIVTHERNVAQAAEENERAARLEADRQRKLADANAKAARETVDTYLVKVSEDFLLNQPGMQTLRKELLELAGGYYQQFIDQHPNDENLQRELAYAMIRVGDITHHVGLQSESLRYYEKAVAARKQIADESSELQDHLDLVDAYHVLAAQYTRVGQPLKRFETLEHAARLLTELESRDRSNVDVKLARSLNLRLSRRPNPQDRVEQRLEALKLVQQVVETTGKYSDQLVSCHLSAGNAYGTVARMSAQDIDKERSIRHALKHHSEALRLQLKILDTTKSLQEQRRLLIAYINVGACEGRLAQFLWSNEETRSDGIRYRNESIASHLTALALAEKLVRGNPSVVYFKRSAATVCGNLGNAHVRLASETGTTLHYPKALEFMLRASKFARQISVDHPDFEYLISHDEWSGRVVEVLREVVTMELDSSEKEVLFDRALAAFLDVDATKRGERDRQNVAKIAMLANSESFLSIAKRDSVLDMAINYLSEGAAKNRTADELSLLGQLLYRKGRYDQSLASFKQSNKLIGNSVPTIERSPHWWYLTMLYHRMGEHDRARQCYDILATEVAVVGKGYQSQLKLEVEQRLGIEVTERELTSEQMLDQLLNAETHYWMPYLNLGFRLKHAGKNDAARRAFAAAASRLDARSKAEEDARVLGYLAQALYESGDYGAAEDALSRCFMLRGETKPTLLGGPRWWYRAMLLAREGNPTRAGEILDKLTNEFQMYGEKADERYRQRLHGLLGISDRQSPHVKR